MEMNEPILDLVFIQHHFSPEGSPKIEIREKTKEKNQLTSSAIHLIAERAECLACEILLKKNKF